MQKLESISAYRKSALQCLGYTVEEGDDIRGRLGVGVVERISIVHFHPDVIQALFFQDEDHPPAAAESKRSYLRSGRKRKLDRGRIPYAIGTRLGMKENECHLSPTLDSSGMITLFALPNYGLNHAAIDVADAVMKRDWGNLYCTSSNGSTTMMGDPSLEKHHTRTPENQVTTTNTPVHDEPSIELLKHDNIRLTIMYFQLVKRYDQEVKARAACEQLAVSLQSKIDTLASVLNGSGSSRSSNKSSSNSSTESRSRTNANVGGRKPTAKNLPTTTENLASNDSNSVSGLLQLLHNGKRSPPSRSDGELGPRAISDF